MATMYVEQAPHPTADGIVTALAHNVLEVTNTSEEALVEHLGRGPAAAISVLTVDRARQEDPAYLRAYYQAISETPLAPSVKVLDKVDNLYLLCLNANDRVRTRYLAEIEEHLIPLARASIPSVVPLIGALVEDNRRLGHRPLEVLMTEVE
ncbi:hypothetical protein [Labilithrix luteola]|uniref:hypothetical protein n=1 Tax=Labilithrix luteola TaxID=1391654 RepID=UPI0011BACF98|nr:hypothetical protein [Labilithrix luteola]